jgi:hypothetical protein
MTGHKRGFRRPNRDDVNQIIQIICKLADEAAKLILAIHGVR